MAEGIFSALVGLACIILGMVNRTGNISSLHSYHRKRVSEEDRVPFGKLVGLGMIIIGASLILNGAAACAAILLSNELYIFIGSGVMGVGLVAGLGISFFAMKKYNKGIF